MSRKKILWCGEATYMNTGYSIIGKEVLSRLYALDRYEIAEFASYSDVKHLQRFYVPWRLYSNMPGTEQEEKVYHSRYNNQFGAWRFEDVVLDFQPDVVTSIADFWMMEHILKSPLRPYYQLLIMPTIDSAPQHDLWLYWYSQADAIFTYSKFGYDTLLEQGKHTMKLCGVTSPSVDTNIFKPINDKSKLRKQLGIPENANIIGFVARNQKRKLFMDLMRDFREFLDQNPHLISDTFLLLHTSYPDMGWNLPKLLNDLGVSRNVLFSYVCSKCRHLFVSHFVGARSVCPKCQRYESHMPNVVDGVTNEQLSQVYNTMDLYVQYAIAEGYSIPIVEAGACGIPVMCVDYSAMSSNVELLKGYPIKVGYKFLEAETQANRVYPDSSDFIQKLTRFFQLPKSLRQKKGTETYLAFLKNYSYDKMVDKWCQVIDGLPQLDTERWNAPPKLHNPESLIQDAPLDKMDNLNFINWCILNILKKPELLHSYFAEALLRDLNNCVATKVTGGNYNNDQSLVNIVQSNQVVDRKLVIDTFMQMREQINYWEQRRAGLIPDRPNTCISNVKPDEQTI